MEAGVLRLQLQNILPSIAVLPARQDGEYMHFRARLSLESWRPLPIMFDSKNTSRSLIGSASIFVSQVFIIDYHV